MENLGRVRQPAVAGSFYAGSAAALRRQIEDCFRHPLGPGALPRVAAEGPREIIGLISPHAGYMYSGPVVAHGFFHLAADGRPQVAVILGPNHRGWGAPVALAARGSWRTPLGEVEIDRPTAQALLAASPLIKEDDSAHIPEHSLEVQVPFLQYLYGADCRIVPITLWAQDQATSLKLGQALAQVLAEQDAVLIASTDFTHYERHEVACQQDRLALEPIQRLDAPGLGEVVKSRGISMCGPGPTMAVLVAAAALGAERAELLRYATSGETGGDYGGVVGYASLKVARPSASRAS